MATDRVKYKTRSIDGNGLCPVWNEKCGPWDCSMPELASLGFVVYNTDMFGDPHAVAQRYFPIGSKNFTCIRQVGCLLRLPALSPLSAAVVLLPFSRLQGVRCVCVLAFLLSCWGLDVARKCTLFARKWTICGCCAALATDWVWASRGGTRSSSRTHTAVAQASCPSLSTLTSRSRSSTLRSSRRSKSASPDALTSSLFFALLRFRRAANRVGRVAALVFLRASLHAALSCAVLRCGMDTPPTQLCFYFISPGITVCSSSKTTWWNESGWRFKRGRMRSMWTPS